MTQMRVRETETTDVVVVGGGLAGLVAATVAARADQQVVLLEPRPLGGRARTQVRDGFVFNQGPRALYRNGAGRSVLDELGVPSDRSAQPPSKGSVVLHRGRLAPLPQGLASLMRTSLLSPAEKAKLARLMAKLPRLDPDSFASLSFDEALERMDLGPVGGELFAALVRLTTYSAATDRLDAPAALAQVKQAADGGVLYLDGGWQPLVDGLAARATEAGADLRVGEGHGATEVTERDGSPLVVTAAGERFATGSVVVAAGGPDAAAAILGGRPASWPTLGPPALAACLELGLRRRPATRFVLGVDEPLYLSTHAPPADLAPDGAAVVHLMRYLRHDDDRPATEVRRELWDLARVAGIDDADVVADRFLARMSVTGAIPVADGGGLPGRVSVEVEDRPGILLAGDWVGAEGLLADAALASGDRAGSLASCRGATLEVA